MHCNSPPLLEPYLSWYARRTLYSRVRSFDSAIVNSAACIACANDSPGDKKFRPTASPMRLSLHTLVADIMKNNWHVCCLGMQWVTLRAIGLLHPPCRIFGGRGNTKSLAAPKHWGCCVHWSIGFSYIKQKRQECSTRLYP